MGLNPVSVTRQVTCATGTSLLDAEEGVMNRSMCVRGTMVKDGRTRCITGWKFMAKADENGHLTARIAAAFSGDCC